MGFLAALFPGSIWLYLVGALAIGGGAAWTSYEVTAAFKDQTISSLRLADAKAAAAGEADYRRKATQLAADNFASGEKYVLDLGANDTVYKTIFQKAPTYVTPVQESKSCLTVGLVRLLAAESRGLQPESLELAPGVVNDDCSDLTARALADWFGLYAEAASANSLQLNALEASVLANAKTVGSEP